MPVTPSTLDWLRARTDDELAALFTARPDLMMPAPPDVAALARRLDSDATARRAVGRCDAFDLQVLQALWALSGARVPVAVAGVTALLGGPADDDDVGRTMDSLHVRGLVHATGNATSAAPNGTSAARAPFVIPDATVRALGRFPAGLGDPSELTAEETSAALGAVGEEGMTILRRLVPGPPVGTVEPGSTLRPAVDTLVASHLLLRQDSRTVMLPREVALELRGHQPLGPAHSRPPELVTRRLRGAAVDATAGGQALIARARAVAVLTALGQHPVPALKSGGMGITALRRLAKTLELEIGVTALYLELLHGAGLIGPSTISPTGATAWTPLPAADEFREASEPTGWALLTITWLDGARDVARVGDRDADGTIRNVLSAALDWRGGPHERREVLRETAGAEANVDVDEHSLVDRLAYRRPFQGRGDLAARVTEVLAQATELGIVAFHSLSRAGAVALDHEFPDVVAAIDSELPDPVASVVIQADMTIVAPGRLTRDLATFLDEIAAVESTGSATVYRLTEASVRRGLDAGFSRTDLHELLARYSATPVPQSVTYLIDDVSRRHGVMRAGEAQAFVRSEDPALITQAVAAAAAAGMELRTLAPTVAVTGMDLSLLLETLRGAGLSPALEDFEGSVVDVRASPRRARLATPTEPPSSAGSRRRSPFAARPRFSETRGPDAQQITSVIARMRAGEDVAGKASAPRDILTLLREAAGSRDRVWIGYADAQGVTSTRLVEPIVVSGGTMVAYDRLQGEPRTFTLHRVSSAHPDSETA